MEREQEGRHKTEENRASSSGSTSKSIPEIVQVGVEKKGSDEASSSSTAPPIEFNDGRGGTYKIQAFIGDICPDYQVYRAEFIKKSSKSKTENTDEDDHGSGEVVLVALKLRSPIFSYIPPDGGYIELLPYDENHNLFGLMWQFHDKNLCCGVMPYFDRGSLRYIISRTPLKKLPEDCIAVILREVLRGLSNLHRDKRYHSQVNAGYIFVAETPKLSIKLCDMLSKYFHNPEKYCPRKIWDEGWSSADDRDRFPVSHDPTNKIWTCIRFFEPKEKENNISAAADIFSLGVTAIEMAWGPMDPSYEQTKISVRTVEDYWWSVKFIRDCLRAKVPITPTVNKLFLEVPLGRRSNPQQSSNQTQETGEEQGRMKILMEAASEEFKDLRKKIVKFIDRITPKGTPEGIPDLADERSYQVSNSFIKFVRRCIAAEPAERPSAKELLKDAFFKKYKNVPLQRFADVVLKRT